MTEPELVQLVITLFFGAVIIGSGALVEALVSAFNNRHRNRAIKFKFEPHITLFDPGDLVKETFQPHIEASGFRNVRVVNPREGEVLGEANPFAPNFLVRWNDGKTEEVHISNLRRSEITKNQPH